MEGVIREMFFRFAFACSPVVTAVAISATTIMARRVKSVIGAAEPSASLKRSR